MVVRYHVKSDNDALYSLAGLRDNCGYHSTNLFLRNQPPQPAFWLRLRHCRSSVTRGCLTTVFGCGETAPGSLNSGATARHSTCEDELQLKLGHQTFRALSLAASN
jgi:hypothetical protein